MPSEKARSLDHFYELLATGQHPKIELDFDVAADDFLKSPPSLAILARGSPGLTNDLLLRSSRRKRKRPPAALLGATPAVAARQGFLNEPRSDARQNSAPVSSPSFF